MNFLIKLWKSLKRKLDQDYIDLRNLHDYGKK